MPYRKRLFDYYVSSHIEREEPTKYYDLSASSLIYRRTVIDPFLPKDRNIQILDLGCGYGPFLYACCEAGYKNVIGVEGSQEQILLAERLGVKHVIHANIIEYLTGIKDKYEIITAFDVIEHFNKSELFDILDKIYSSLKVGGSFIMRTPNAENPFFGLHRYGDFTHEICFNRISLYQVLRTIGFKDVACYEDMPYGHSSISCLRWACCRIIRVFYRLLKIGDGGGLHDKPIFSQNIIAVARK